MTGNSADIIMNNYDLAIRGGETILLKTYLPDQYAAMPAGSISGNQYSQQEIVLRSRRGTELLRLQEGQLITLQALLLGKIHDQTFFTSVVMKKSVDVGMIDMNRSLVKQLLALELNRSREGNALLNDFRLDFENWLVTQQLKPSAAGAASSLSPCGVGVDSRVVYSWKFPLSLKNLLGEDNTVQALNDLVVEVLAGNRVVTKSQLSDLVDALRIINEAFEKGRFMIGWSQHFVTCSNSWIMRWKMLTPELELPVDEKNYTTKARLLEEKKGTFLKITANINSRVLVELYSEKGSRIEKFYHSQLAEGETLRFEIKHPSKGERLVYKVTADGRTYSGLIP
jgi:hypothetical protein